MTQREEDAHLISISRMRNEDGVEVSEVAFRGSVRSLTADEFRSRLGEAGDRSRYLLVDLSELDYVSSTGLGMLLSRSRVQEECGGWLRLVNPSRSVAMILDLSGVGRILMVAPEANDALRDLPGRAA